MEVRSPRRTIFSKQPKTPSITKALKVLEKMKQKLPTSKETVEEVNTAPLSFSDSDAGSSSGEPYVPYLPQEEMVFEAATPVTPVIPEDQPLGTQDKDEGNADNAFEAQPVKKPATEDVNVDALGINWDRTFFVASPKLPFHLPWRTN